MSGRLDGKVAIVVGAGQTPGDTIGNGRATALLFAREGARVVAVDRRIDSANQLLELLGKEDLPFVVAGDLNSPSGGFIHGLFTASLRDAHQVAGRGLGHTFPGKTRNPLSRGGPWMRIDYILTGPGWSPIHSVTEEDRTSQHRAIAATLQLD